MHRRETTKENHQHFIVISKKKRQTKFVLKGQRHVKSIVDLSMYRKCVSHGGHRFFSTSWLMPFKEERKREREECCMACFSVNTVL